MINLIYKTIESRSLPFIYPNQVSVARTIEHTIQLPESNLYYLHIPDARNNWHPTCFMKSIMRIISII